MQRAENRDKIKALSEASEAHERTRSRPPFQQHRRKRPPIPAVIVAYDLETTRIAAGTPDPVYITASAPWFKVDGPVRSMRHLEKILVSQFLLDEYRGTKYVAWNGNRFDGYIVAIALLMNHDFIIRPYMTRSHSLRGIRIQRATDTPGQKGWEFLCGIAMLGLEGVSLDQFTANFAPDYRKLKDAIDFEKEEFDPKNKVHRAYAFRDSEGLWHGMEKAQQIMLETFDAPLAVTMGGVCIKIFAANIPPETLVFPLDPTCEGVFREYVMRGGFCYCARRYQGPVWKYDVNQAYAAAMRESPMPCGQMLYHPSGIYKNAMIYIAEVEATNPDNRIPFYYRGLKGTRIQSLFATTRIERTWLTSVEIAQLVDEGWKVRAFQSYQWAETFTMTEFVDRLERLRMTCEGGPSGAIGTMVKATGNHAYGKTVEESSAMEFLIADAPPKDQGWEPYFGDGSENEPIEHVWYRFTEETRPKIYHAVQLGAFITAAVRMKVRRAALLRPESWLYADTDCVMFDSDVTALLDIDPMRYGAWKVEETGKPYRVIAKKVYAEIMEAPDAKPKKRSAKGLNVRKLDDQAFEAWFNGAPPVQQQIQRNNFLAVSQSAAMFRAQQRRGTAVSKE